MPDNALEKNFIKFASNLTVTIRKLSLYPVKHPAVVYSIKEVFSVLQEIFKIKDVFNISLTADNRILIEGQSVSDKGINLIQDLAAYFKKLEIESLTFNSGITDRELEAFIRILLMGPEDVEKAGGLEKVFLDNEIQQVKISQFSYVKVQKGKDLLEAQDEKQQLLNKLNSKIKEYSQGRINNLEDILRLEKDIIDIVGAEFKENKRLSVTTKNMLKRFLFKSESKEDVFSRLKDALLDFGCLPQEVDKLINKIREEVSKKAIVSIARMQGIDLKEGERLIRKNEDLFLKINQLQKELESKTTAFEELKKENKNILREKERVDNIVHHMAEGMVVVDPDGKIVMMNPVAERLLGIGKDKLGISVNEAIHDEHLLTMVKKINPEKDEALQKDIEVSSPDETTKKILRASSAVIEDCNGKTVGMVTMLNDITKQKELERMKSAFVANVSHELRTPLATIQQNITLLTEGLPGVLNEAQMKFLNISQNNIKRLRRLINDLLDSAAIEAGKFHIRLSKVDINERINNVVTFLSKWAQTKNISIKTDLPPESEFLEIDKDRIEQVLTNLISNAVKFTPEGGGVFISAVKRDQAEDIPQGAIEISVRDTGPGIAPDDIGKIFQKFERGSAVNSGIGGTGLGLTICKEIIKMHGGKIWVESKLNEGSKFSFLLPIKNLGDVPQGDTP
ncbi:MAG: ATP-binding protein [Candidatus Omnitrophota bacterium]